MSWVPVPDGVCTDLRITCNAEGEIVLSWLNQAGEAGVHEERTTREQGFGFGKAFMYHLDGTPIERRKKNAKP
ncbi:MAG TPA: hypothetical protein DD727_04665 [Clostridiales bacterium]|nr:hypothetical protein [Clostridiales bacterium]